MKGNIFYNGYERVTKMAPGTGTIFLDSIYRDA